MPSITTGRGALTSSRTAPRSPCGWSPTRAIWKTSSSGRGRDAGRREHCQGPQACCDATAAILVLLHGDAPFAAQGAAATLNLGALDGDTVSGTIHLIENNEIGFTTDPQDGRSTTWSSDLAKGFDVPIIHVNADDVAACISAVRLAFAFTKSSATTC